MAVHAAMGGRFFDKCLVVVVSEGVSGDGTFTVFWGTYRQPNSNAGFRMKTLF